VPFLLVCTARTSSPSLVWCWKWASVCLSSIRHQLPEWRQCLPHLGSPKHLRMLRKCREVWSKKKLSWCTHPCAFNSHSGEFIFT
jgi:hypothetical protein